MLKRGLAVGGLGLCLWLFIMPAPGFGQGSTWAGEGLARALETAMWRSGSLRANAAFRLMDAGYDSDIYYGFYGEPVPNAVFAASVPVQLLMSVNKTTVLEVYDSPRYDFYLDTKSERAWNNTLRGQLHFALSKIYFRVGGELANNRRRLSQELDVNIREKTGGLNALALWQATRSASLALVYDQTRFDYGTAIYHGTSLAETLNRRVDSLEFAAFLHADPRFRFFVDGQYANYAFSDPVSQIKDTRSYAVFGGFVSVIHPQTARQAGRIDGYVRLGYMKFDVLAPEVPDGAGLVGDVDLSVGIFRLTDARLFYSKGYEFSIYEGATFYGEQNYGAGITRHLSRHTFLSYELSFGRSSFPQPAENGTTPLGVLYRFSAHRLNVTTMLSKYLRISLSGTLGRRLTSQTGQAWNRYTVGVTIDYGTVVAAESGPLGGLLRSSSGITD